LVYTDSEDEEEVNQSKKSKSSAQSKKSNSSTTAKPSKTPAGAQSTAKSVKTKSVAVEVRLSSSFFEPESFSHIVVSLHRSRQGPGTRHALLSRRECQGFNPT
jgi:hypothetical protein